MKTITLKTTISHRLPLTFSYMPRQTKNAPTRPRVVDPRASGHARLQLAAQKKALVHIRPLALLQLEACSHQACGRKACSHQATFSRVVMRLSGPPLLAVLPHCACIAVM